MRGDLSYSYAVNEQSIVPRDLERSGGPGPMTLAQELVIAELKRFPTFARDLVPALRELAKEPTEVLRVIIPPDAIEGLRSGNMRWIEAKDGSGLLPTLQDLEGKWKRQVRLEFMEVGGPDLALLQGAVEMLATQGMLREISAKLERIEAKIDRMLAYVEADWRAVIEDAHKRLNQWKLEPGNPSCRASALAIVERDLSEALSRGLRRLAVDLVSLPSPKRGMMQFLPKWNRSREYAEKLDPIMDRVSWCYLAMRTLSEVDIEMERPRAASRRLVEFGDGLRQLKGLAQARDLSRYAEWSAEREMFWNTALPALQAIDDQVRQPIEIPVRVGELLSITVSNQTSSEGG